VSFDDAGDAVTKALADFFPALVPRTVLNNVVQQAAMVWSSSHQLP